MTRHVGRNLRDVVQAGIERAMKSVSHFADKWSVATVENFLDRYGVDDVETVFRALVANRAVHVPGYGTDEMVERLQRAWDVEPGYSKTAFICWRGASTLAGRAGEAPTAGLPAARGHPNGVRARVLAWGPDGLAFQGACGVCPEYDGGAITSRAQSEGD